MNSRLPALLAPSNRPLSSASRAAIRLTDLNRPIESLSCQICRCLTAWHYTFGSSFKPGPKESIVHLTSQLNATSCALIIWPVCAREKAQDCGGDAISAPRRLSTTCPELAMLCRRFCLSYVGWQDTSLSPRQQAGLPSVGSLREPTVQVFFSQLRRHSALMPYLEQEPDASP